MHKASLPGCRRVAACTHLYVPSLRSDLWITAETYQGDTGGGHMMMMYGSLRAAIIHRVKTSLDKTGWSGVIQGNRIEAALTVFDSLMQNMMLGLL